MSEITAYHESGHAFAAVYLGARIRSMTIDPDWDDGPQRFGDTQVEWDQNLYSDEDFHRACAAVALAGPVSEMIFTGDPWHPALVPEWSFDWKIAWDAAGNMIGEQKKRIKLLEDISIQFHGLLSRDDHWQAIASLADELQAHEFLEGGTVHDILSVWMR